MRVNGDYNVEVKIFSYDNPTGRCRSCRRENGDGIRSCCDDFSHFDSCSGDRRCDSYFIYCLRPFGMTRPSCSGFTQKMSTVNIDDRSINFSRNKVLGLNNPLILSGLTTGYDSSNVS